MKKALEAVLARAWAITDDALETIASIASREHEFSGNLEALEAKLGRPLGNTQTVTIRDGIATIPVEGPLFAKANIMTAYSGATSYDMLALDFTAALNDPSVKGIILNIDSPGGEVSGVSELSQLISASRGVKPLVAFVSGNAASGGYWLASTATRVVAADTAIIGSIGVQMGLSVKDPKAGERSYRFVSSNAQNKNADPGTDAGAIQVQAMIDGLEKVFIDTLAANRGTTAENVVKSFGQGAVFVAAEALNRGMIDAIGTYESVFSDLSKEVSLMDYASLTVASLTEHRPDLAKEIGAQAVASIDKPDAAALRAEGATAERNRINGIEALAMPGAESVIAEAKADATATPRTTAIKVLAALRANPVAASNPANAAAAALAVMQNTEQAITPPVPAANGGKDTPADSIEFAMASAKAAGQAV